MMKEYGDEPFIRFVREKQVMGRNWDIRKGSVWPDGEEMLFAEREVIKKDCGYGCPIVLVSSVRSLRWSNIQIKIVRILFIQIRQQQ